MPFVNSTGPGTTGGYSEPWEQFTIRIDGELVTFNSYYEYEDYIRFIAGERLGLGADSPGLAYSPYNVGGVAVDTPSVDTNANLGGSSVFDAVPSPSSPSISTLDVVVQERLNMTDGEAQLQTTGPLQFLEFTGWDNPAGAQDDDGVEANTSSPGSGFSAGLVAKGFRNLNIPANAVISGIKVTVKRRVV